MPEPKFEYPLAFVVWEDAYSHEDWASIQEAKSHEKCIVNSVGWLIDESDEHVTIVQSFSDNEARSRFTIPKVFIQSMETLIGNGKWKKIIK